MHFQGKTRQRRSPLFYALTSVKRAGLAISEKKQKQSLVKHVRNMNGAEYKPRPVVVPFYMSDESPLLNVRVHEPDEVLEHVKYRVRCLLGDSFKGSNANLKYNWRVPSVNACYENRAKDGGSHVSFQDSHWYTQLVYREFIGYAHYRTYVHPVYVPYHPEDLKSEVRSKFLEHYAKEPPRATVHKVLEPFKCRIITAGNAVPYQLGRMAQKPIHTVMRNYRKIFHLTGAPVTLEFIQEIYNDTILFDEGENRIGDEVFTFDPLRDRRYNSLFSAGDYSAATDGMHPELNRTFVEHLSLITNMPPLIRQAMFKCF